MRNLDWADRSAEPTKSGDYDGCVRQQPKMFIKSGRMYDVVRKSQDGMASSYRGETGVYDP